MPETLQPNDVYEIQGENDSTPIYLRILVLGPSDLSTKVGPATKAEFEAQQVAQKP
jgi:hypothetical protein